MVRVLALQAIVHQNKIGSKHTICLTEFLQFRYLLIAYKWKTAVTYDRVYGITKPVNLVALHLWAYIRSAHNWAGEGKIWQF